jgi:phytoene/squalene synthetase
VDLFIAGGRAILRALERIDYDVLSQRPEVTKSQKANLLLAAIGRRIVG